MRFSIGFLSLIAAQASASACLPNSYQKVIERDVVVIGGGSSGTYAAVRLTDSNVSVVVLEKEDHLGGHTVTYTDPDTRQPFNLGVIIFHKSDIVKNYFGRFGVGLTDVTTASLGGNTTNVDFSSGHLAGSYKPVSTQALAVALQKYGEILATKYPYLSLGYDLPDPVPAELLAPYSEFIKNNDLGDIVQFVNNIGSNGGDILNRPTVYGIKLLSPLLLQAVSEGFVTSATGDNLALYRGAQKLLEKSSSVIYKTTVTKVTRSASGVQVLADTPSGKVLIKAKKVVFAIPPMEKNLKQVGLDITKTESSLFSKFTGYLYGSAVFTHPGFSASKSFTNIGQDTDYHLLRLPGSFSYSPLVGQVATNKVSCYYGGLDANTSEDDVKAMIEDELFRLNRQAFIGEGKPDFKYFGNHAPYHMHVSGKEVKNGFYKQVYGLEGVKNTFWTGAAFVDNDSTLLWTWTESFLLPRILASLKSKY